MAQAKRRRPAPQELGHRSAVVALGLGGLAVSIVATACGGGGTTHTAQPVVVSTAPNATHGSILVSGNTLYTLKPSQTPCTAECSKIWPPLLLPKGVAAATAGTGVSSSNLGTVARPGGQVQVTYSGQALYFFVDDKAPGQVNGNVTDTWGTWSDVAPGAPSAGSSVPASGAPTSSTPTTAQPLTTTAPTTAAPTTTTTAPKSGGAGF